MKIDEQTDGYVRLIREANRSQKPLVRNSTPEEREVAAFMVGMIKAFDLRGYPSSTPRAIFRLTFDTASGILSGCRVGAMDEAQVKTMRSLAGDFGWPLPE